jgi:competence protein ComEC
VPVLGGFALGVLLDATLRPAMWPWVVLSAAALAAALWGVRRGLKPWGHWALALLLLVPFGGFWHDVRFRQVPPWHLKNLPLDGEQFYYVRGRVTDIPRMRYRRGAFAPEGMTAEAYWLLQIRAEALSGDGTTWQKAAGGMTVFVGAWAPSLEAGDEVEFLCRPRTNRGPTNPGERDVALATERAGSCAAASVDSPSAFVLLRRAQWYGSVPAAVGRLRSYVWHRLAQALPAGAPRNHFGFVGALLLGERDALTPSQERLLKESGTLHFLAISGLHVGLFYLFVAYGMALLPLPVRLRAVLGIALVWCYVAFTGAHVSALRSGWMLTFLLAAPLLERQRDSYSALAGAALVILLISPQELFTPGFQLSFAAVWAMISIYPHLHGVLWPWEDFLARMQQPEEAGLLRGVWVWARSYLLLSCVVWVATAPILIYHFNAICFFSPLVNLLLWPLVLLLLLTCFLLVACIPLGAAALGVAGWIAGFFGDSIETLLGLASRLPGFGIYMPSLPAWWVGLFCVALGGWAARGQLTAGREAPAARRGFIIIVAVLALAYTANEVAARWNRQFTLTVADVGSGQSALLQTPEGQALLFDAGSSRRGAERAVADLLWYRRVGKVSAVVVSHGDNDHCDFIPFLNGRFAIGQIVVPAVAQLTSFSKQVRQCLGQDGLVVHPLVEKAALTGGGTRCVVLHPNARFAFEPSLKENDRSLVFRCSYDGLTLLLPGDIQSDAIRRLNVDYGDRLKADVLVMPHHGHYGDGLDEFVAHVHPALAVVSGRAKDCDPRTRATLDQQRVPLWLTETEGAVIITLRDGKASVAGCKSGRSMAFEPAGSAGLMGAAAQEEQE